MDNVNLNDTDEFIKFLIMNYIDEDKFSIDKKEEDRKINYQITIEGKEIAKILGRNGRIANSIRELAKSLPKEKKRIYIKFNSKEDKSKDKSKEKNKSKTKNKNKNKTKSKLKKEKN